MSYNDMLNPVYIRKLTMASPAVISQAILFAGRGALISKVDVVDAFKLIPCNIQEWGHFGFKWLGKYFADVSTPFGSKSAPANFDCLGETIVNVVKTLAEIPDNTVFRQLDDISIVAPRQSNLADRFTKTLKFICAEINVPLAENCPDHDKAFDVSTFGTILGIRFNTNALSWSLPVEKQNQTLSMLKSFLFANTISLLDFQKLHGKINAFANMFVFLKGFRYHQAAFLRKFAETKCQFLLIPDELKKEIWIWTKVLLTSNCYPIANLTANPSLYVKKFVSDAAGLQKNFSDVVGAASLSFNNKMKCTFAAQIFWTNQFLNFVNSNASILETIGLLLPFISIPKSLAGNEIVLEVDNLAVVFAWQNKYSKNDELTSILIQCLHVLEALLPCKIYVQHLPRCSTTPAILADALTRKSTTTTAVLNQIQNIFILRKKSPLKGLIKKPRYDWNLPLQLSDHVRDIMSRN
jgi:hypothetical protein